MTLVELIVAMTLTVMVAGSTAAILTGVSSARTRVDRQMALQQEARVAARTILTALRNAYRSTGKDAVIEGQAVWIGDLRADTIRFYTVSRAFTSRDLRPGEPESDVWECQFLLTRFEDEKLPALMRRMDPARKDYSDGTGVGPEAEPVGQPGGILERVAGNVVALAFSYFDGREWQTDWPITQRRWPLAVRVELLVADPANPATLLPVSDVVNLPYRVEGRQASSSGTSGSSGTDSSSSGTPSGGSSPGGGSSGGSTPGGSSSGGGSSSSGGGGR